MLPLYQFSEIQALAFVLILLRISTFIVIWPVFSSYSVPAYAKTLMALVISMVVFPIVGWQHLSASFGSMEIVWLAGREIFIGLALGFITRLFFYAVSVGGELISLAMGLSSAQMFNPSLNSSGSSIEQFENILASLIFLAINGHHLFLSGLFKSFEAVPLSLGAVQFFNPQYLGTIVQAVVVAGLKLSAPVMISVLFLNIAMGIAGRAVPQMNVLVMSLPVTILAGFAILLVALPLYFDQTSEVLNSMTEYLFGALKAL